MTSRAGAKPPVIDKNRASPRASSLIEAMRSLGYTIESAIADLVDNSISHGASTIHVEFDWNGSESTVAISDDGSGMSEAQLINAMRPGTHNPRDVRAKGDLGRFGLGMKTASFSQAKRMTVVSRAANESPAIRIWDLDYVCTADDWLLLRDPSEIATNQATWTLAQKTGTCVVWERLDRLVGEADIEDERSHRAFLDAADRVSAHLAMVFGEFLTGPKAIRLFVGNVRIKRWDPFQLDHPATQRLHSEPLTYRGGKVSVQPYVLPHHSKMTPDQFREAAGVNGWNANQGFYIFRNNRLLVAGGWLGLGLTRDEHMKLARIRIDVGNDTDFDWKLDVRKSRASPPVELREDLRRIARLTRDRAQEVYRHRGRRLVNLAPGEEASVWEAVTMRGKNHFRINRSHPVVHSIMVDSDGGRAVSALLRLIEETVPLASIYIRHAESPETQRAPFDDTKDSEVLEMLSELYLSLLQAGRSHASAIASLSALAVARDRPHLINSLNETPPKPPEVD